MFTCLKLKKLFKRNRVLFPLVLVVLLIFAFSISLRPAAGDGSGVTSGGGIAFEKAVDSQFAKPGDKVNFTLSYLSNLGETVYNVTVYDWMPPELAFVSSYPFYDGASEPEIGFYRWSRGRVLPSGNGTIVVSALVNEVPVGEEITNTAHLAYEFGNGTRAEVTSDTTVTVTQAAGVDIFPDQIHSVAPHTGAQTEYNITLKNTGNALDTFDVILKSLAYSPSGSGHDWKIELFNPEGYFTNSPVATVYDDNLNNRTAWTDHGVVTNVTLGMGGSTWFMLRVTEAGGTSGSGDAFLDVHLIARSLFDPNVSDMNDENTIVRSIAGITFAPDYSKEANPGETVMFSHIIVNSGQSEVIDLSYVSPVGWSYSFFYGNSTALADTDGSGHVDVGVVPRDQYVYISVKVTVPYNTPVGIVDSAWITATGVSSGSLDTVNDTTTVKSAPMLGISKTLVSENPAYEGDVVTYEIHIVNLGNTRLIKIPLDDTFETACLDFSSAQPVEGSYDELAGNIHWDNLGTLEPGQSVNVTINFVATAGEQAVRESSNVIDAEDESGNLVSATCMNTDLNLVGSYTLTVTASPAEAIGAAFEVTWTGHGSVKDSTFATPKMIACDEGTTVTIGSSESPINDGDARYVFVDFSPSSVLSMDSDKTVTLNYRTEYSLTFDQTGNIEDVYVIVDGIQLSDALPQSFWIEKGSVVTFSYPSVVTDSVGTTRYVLTGVLGNETDTSVTVNAPTVVAGLYKTQYHLSVITDPEGLDDPQNSGWYDDGTYAQLKVEALTGGDGTTTRFRFDHWSGMGIDNASDASTQILMDAPKTATAYFIEQYYIAVFSLHDFPASSQWVDEGASLTASVASPAETIIGQTQWKCTGYGLDGEAQLGTTCALDDIQAPHTIEFQWIQQFWLQVDSSLADVSVTGTGWYDLGTVASISTAGLYQPSYTHRFIFAQWVSTGSEEAPIAEPRFSNTTIAMSNYYTVQATGQEQWYITVISPHDAPTSSQWVNATESLQVNITSPADDNGAGTRYRSVGYTIDANDMVEGSSHTFVSVDAAHTIEFKWVTQHYLTILVSPPDVLEVIPGEGWYDGGTVVKLAASSVVSVSEGVQYRFDQWSIATATFPDNLASFSVNAPITATAEFIKQFYLTISTNFGDVSPQSGWRDFGSTVSIEAFAPAIIEGKGYVWHGWTGTGDGSYSDIDNPAKVVINSVIAETAAWKIDPAIHIVISSETIANGDRIVVYGETSPAQSGLAIAVFYNSPSGSSFEHTVYTDDDGKFKDTLVLDQHDLYRLLIENGEWNVTALRQHDDSHENAQGSTTLKVESQPMIPFPPILLAGAILVAGVIAFVPPARNKKNGNRWRRVAAVFNIAALVLGAVSLMLSWIVVTGTVTSTGVAYRVGVQLYPLSQGVVSISDGITYVGPQVSSMAQMSSDPVLSLYLIPVACAAALMGLYKPKSVRRRNLKIVILVIAGLLIAASVINTYLFVQIQGNAIKGAGIGYGTGLYAAITSCALILVSSLFATRENNNSFIETPRTTVDKTPAAFSRVPAFLVHAMRDTHDLITQSFNAMFRIPTKEERLQSKMQKARRAYVKERTRQQGLLKDELANLNLLLNGGSIDEETGARLKKVLKIGYETKREETRGKYGFPNRSTQVN